MSSFVVRVKTGRKLGIVGNTTVKIRLHDADGMHTRWIELEVGPLNAVQSAEATGMPIGKQIDKIEVRRDKYWFRKPIWYAEHIEIEEVEAKSVFFFPIHRWIVEDHTYTFKQYDTMLPQIDAENEQRLFELREKKKLYQFYRPEKGLPVGLRSIPEDEKWSLDWQSHQRTRLLKLHFEQLLTKVNTVCRSWSSVKDIEQLYESVSWGSYYKPKDIIDRWNEDKWFGAQRLCGLHAFAIRRCKEIPEKFGVSADEVEQYLDEDMTLEKALDKKRIYIVDLEINEKVGMLHDLKPYGPIGLFYVNDDQDLMPIAIQLHQEKGEKNPVFYPGDDANLWTIAKLWFNQADGYQHEAIGHLGLCHMVLDGIAISTHRNLSPSHPIYKLLMPHFYNTFAIDILIPAVLTGPDAKLVNASHRIQGVGLPKLIKEAFKDFRLDLQSDLVNDLKDRGVDDEDDLPNYHIRDDALLLWWAILKYVEKIVKLYYEDDDAVKFDTELKLWGEELTKPYPDGAGFQGVADGGSFNKREELISVCLQIIYTASVKHAVHNNPQYEAYAWAPNYPTWLRGDPPRDKKPKTKADVMATLPTKDAMLSCMMLMQFISETTDDNSLGNFVTSYFHSPEAKEIHQEFLDELKDISEKIKERNDYRKYKYEWLDPEHIGNSIYI